MIRIPYPIQSEDFDNRYIQKLMAANIQNFDKANTLLKKINYQGEVLKVESLLVAVFEKLLSIHETIKNNLSKNEFTEFEKLFNYHGGNQRKIADFFMQQIEIPMDSCFYCNIDFINSFTDIADYKNDIDFVNNAQEFELEQLHGVGKRSATVIIGERLKRKEGQGKGFTDINQVPRLNKKAKEQLKSLDFLNTHNHFTLDHFLPQSKYKCLSLCLYNFVPTCYACNSKFKKDKEFSTMDMDKLKLVSPSSRFFSLHDNFSFKIYYPKDLDDIKTDTDYNLEKEINANNELVQEFLNLYKIEGRYVFHKRVLLKLIEKKLKYPESKIKEISETYGMSVDELRETIFGEELFNADLTTKPLTKLKRDIAKDINIKGVL
ncbi:MAG: hypothetical protein AAF611_21590 [Bacteroidota bacterium]